MADLATKKDHIRSLWLSGQRDFTCPKVNFGIIMESSWIHMEPHTEPHTEPYGVTSTADIGTELDPWTSGLAPDFGQGLVQLLPPLQFTCETQTKSMGNGPSISPVCTSCATKKESNIKGYQSRYQITGPSKCAKWGKAR